MHLSPLDNTSFPTPLASSASLWCFAQAAAQVWLGMATQAPVPASTAHQVWHNHYCCPRPFKTLWNHLRNLCTEKWHFSHHFKATQDSAFLRQMLPSPLLCSPDPPANRKPKTIQLQQILRYVCLLLIFYQSSDLFHQAAWWAEPKEIRAFMQEGN